MASIVSAGTTSATALNMSADTSGVLQLASNNGTVALTVTEAQRIGVGTTTPSTFFDINGTGSGSANNWIFLRAGNTGGTTFPGLAAGVAIGTNFSNGNSETNLVWGQTIGSQQYFSISKWTGSAVTEQFRLNSSGLMTVSAQPAFQATGINSIFTTSSWAKLPFSTEVYDNGGVYTPADSRFTAPVAGKYLFSWSVLHRNTTSGARTAIYKNGAKFYDPGNGNSSQTYNSVNSEVMIGATYILNLAANDYVEIYGIVGSGIGDLYMSTNSHNQFTGYLIG